MARHRRLTKSHKRRAGKMIRRTRWSEKPEPPLPADDA